MKKNIVTVGTWKEFISAIENLNLYKKTFMISGWYVKPKKDNKVLKFEIKKVLLKEVDLDAINIQTLE